MEKTNIQQGLALPLMESFYTVQGEGRYTGHAAYFIRLAGCDVGCHWCDVKESWDKDLHPVVSIENMVEQAKGNGNLVVITGGEPLMWNLNPLTAMLHDHNIQTNIETSGAHPLSGYWDWICLSPKKNKLPLPEIYEVANELKCIIYNNHDFEFAEEQAQKVNKDAILYLQVEWDRREKMMPLVVEYVKKNPKWRISIQTHKYMDIP